MTKIKIGTIHTKASLKQAEYVKTCLADLGIKSEFVWVEEDKNNHGLQRKHAYNETLEDYLLTKKADCVVHNMKHFLKHPAEGLVITAILKRHDVREALISKEHQSFLSLPPHAKIAVNGARRKAQVLSIRSDLDVMVIHEGLDERLHMFNQGKYDAVMVSLYGLKKMGYDDRLSQVLSIDMFPPPISQGALGIEVRNNDTEMIALMNSLNDRDSFMEVEAERACFFTLIGDGVPRDFPVSIYAKVIDAKITVKCVVWSLDGSKKIFDHVIFNKEEFLTAGKTLGDVILNQGAAPFLKS